jgi:hypothetical protein
LVRNDVAFALPLPLSHTSGSPWKDPYGEIWVIHSKVRSNDPRWRQWHES